MNADERRGHLLEQFVGCWEKLDGFSLNESLDPLASHFSPAEKNQSGGQLWRPISQATDPSKLDSLYAKLPAEVLCNERIKVVAELAPTFEQLVKTTIELANRS